MGDIQIDPKKQFSKRLARWTAVFWFVYMTWLSVIMILEPTAAMYSFYMSIVVTIVMMINVVAYTKNSIQEKWLFAMLNRTKMELTLGGGSGKEEKNNAETTGGESNG